MSKEAAVTHRTGNRLHDRDQDVYLRLQALMGENRKLQPNFTDRINGHTIWERGWLAAELISESRYDYDELERLIEAKEKGELPLAEPIRLREDPYARACEYCKHSEFFFDGINIVATEPCPLPDGYPTFTIDLDVPSGKIMFSDWIPGFGPGREEHFDVNRMHGIADAIRAYEADACVHFFVGSTDPTIWREGDSFQVANFPFDDDTGEEIAPESHEEIGRVCTDLWWCTFVDGAEYERRGSREGRWIGSFDVEPGTYRFTYRGLAKGFDRHAETAVYATFEKVDRDDEDHVRGVVES